MNTGVLYGLGVSFFFSLYGLFLKQLQKTFQFSYLSFFAYLFGVVLIVLFPFYPLFFEYFSFWTPREWGVLFLDASGNLLALCFFYRSLRTTDLGITMGGVSLTPLLMIPFSRLLLKETLNSQEILGIVLIVLGCVIYHRWRTHRKDLIGFFWGLGTAIVWSLTANLDKWVLQRTDPFTMIFHFHILFFCLLLLIPKKKKIQLSELRELLRTPFFHLFVLSHLGVLFLQFYGILLIHAPVMIALKRTAILFSIIWGTLFFKEKFFLRRLFSCLLIILGIYLLAVL